MLNCLARKLGSVNRRPLGAAKNQGLVSVVKMVAQLGEGARIPWVAFTTPSARHPYTRLFGSKSWEVVSSDDSRMPTGC